MTKPVMRPLSRQDVDECAAMHRRAFPGFFLSALGEPFLREFYRAFLDDDAVTAVATSPDGRQLLGVVVGHTAPRGFFRRLLIRRWYVFAAASIGLLVRRPSALPRLLRALRYRGQVPVPYEGALLSSICVQPEAQGMHIGRLLIDAWVAQLAGRDLDTAYLTTDGRGNDAVNHFYASSGWRLSGSYRTPEGRLMNCYTWRTPHEGVEGP